MLLPADLVRVDTLDAAWATAGSGARLDAVRKAGRKLRDTILATGPVRFVRTADIATFPYPTSFGFQGAASSLLPFVFMRNRVKVVQVQHGSRTITILVNPTDAARSRKAPFFARMEARFGTRATNLIGTVHNTIDSALAGFGVTREQIDYITFDHLHVQDIRGLLAPGADGTTYLPNAKLLAQRPELDTLLGGVHPLQGQWYIPECLHGVPADRIVALDGDYLLGGGFAIVRTPGHTSGNHSLVIVTDRGAWTISENGIAVDAYAPGISEIRGIARRARELGVECILNANTLEHSLDQYTSMVLEKTIADSVPGRPELPQHVPSSELVAHPLARGRAPTDTHGAISYGSLVPAAAPAIGERRFSAQT